MGRGLTTKERADRQRIMMRLRSWMEENDVPRHEVASEMGITRGHLSTLINANRTASAEQCEKAKLIIGDVGPAPAGVPLMEHKKDSMNMLARSKPKGQKRKKRTSVRRPHWLRPLTEFESKFVQEVAVAWISTNKSASQSDLVDVVRALSIGIRS